MGKKGQYDFGGTDDEDASIDVEAVEKPDSESDGRVDDEESTNTSSASTESDASNPPSMTAEQAADAVEGAVEPPDSAQTVDFQSLPYKLRRDGAKDERPVTKTIYMQQETSEGIDDAHSELQAEFRDEKVHTLDTYEIIMLNGLFDEDGALDITGLRRTAEGMGWGLK